MFFASPVKLSIVELRGFIIRATICYFIKIFLENNAIPFKNEAEHLLTAFIHIYSNV